MAELKFRIMNLRCWCRYNLLWLLILCILLLPICLWYFRSTLLLFFPDLHFLYGGKDSYPIIGSVTVAIIGALGAYITYDNNVKMKTLSYYNEQYRNDENIHAVVMKIDRILSNADNDESNTSKDEVEHNQKVEMFYRFFEELELNIQKGILKRRDVYNLFAYYALEGIINNKLRPCDYPKQWCLLKSFVTKMEPLFKKDRSD